MTDRLGMRINALTMGPPLRPRRKTKRPSSRRTWVATLLLIVIVVGVFATRTIARASTKRTYTYVCVHSYNDNLDVIMFNKNRTHPAHINAFAGTSTTPTPSIAQPRQTAIYDLIPSNNNATWTTIMSDEPLVVGGNESVQNSLTVGSSTSYWYTTWDITCH